MEKVEYDVTGATNNSESRTQLRNALDKVEGVQEVAIDMGKGMVTVEYNEPATEYEIRDCIEKTGYKIL